MDSCVKMLGKTDDKSLFILKETQGAQLMMNSTSFSLHHTKKQTHSYVAHVLYIKGSSEELPPDQQIGSLLTSMSENRQLELHLCKMVTLIILLHV